MSYNLGDFYSDWFKTLGKGGSSLYSAASKVNQHNPFVNDAVRKVASKSSKDVSDFVDDQVVQKSDLRASQILGFLSGFPIVGGLINGFQGAVQMEDLYNNTGKVPAYAGLQSIGTGGIGAAAAQALRVAEGRNDLYHYYAGEPDQWTINMYG